MQNLGYRGGGMKDPFIEQTENVIATASKLLELEGRTKEVAVLAMANAKTVQSGYDNWNGGTNLYTLYLQIPVKLYHRVFDEKEIIQKNILNIISFANDSINYYTSVEVTVQLTDDPYWRENAKAWLRGDGINNQGKVRSDNIASRSHDGLLFRSAQEILLYKALKTSGFSFAPLPVFIRGGKSYKRIEPDFFIVKNGIMMIVEVDGDTVHTETPAEAHARTTMLLHEGVHFERIKASECDTEGKALVCAKRLLEIINKIKNSR